ncbi:MAG: glycosyl hydrolase family protein [Bacteroidia bacterium]|nr:MAG: glycosyl hydrolase family protein [Bacteroidia bacterium]
MASLSFLLGMVPSTEKVETADDKIRADFQAYKDYESSDELKHFLELEKEVKSSAFVVRKKKIKKADYQDSEEFQKQTEYDVLKKSEKVVWYFKTKKKYPFKEIEKWDLTFVEKFNSGRLDTSKWMTRYFWGEKGMNSAFVLEDDKSFLTDGDNIEFYDNKARIVTKASKVQGLTWRSEQGFVIEDFDFTSGMISTAKSFRQKYGVFNAKIKMAGGSVAQAFWMVSNTMLPHIDVARFENGKLYANYFWGGGQSNHKSLSKTGGTKYADEYYIFTLEWTPNKLTWKINGKVFKTQSSGVPQEEMSINFSSNLKKDASESGLPSAMEIDWIRVYKLKGER